MRSIRAISASIILTLAVATFAPAAIDKTDVHRDRILQERTYRGKPVIYWLNVIRNRDEEMISVAFDAVRSLGDDGWVAVPDLTRVVEASFDAIQIGKDSHDLIASKLYDIAVRSEAIDVLGSIGETASPSTIAVIRWAMLPRLIPGAGRNADDDELFLELVAMDAEQRMRAATAIEAFGRPAFPMIAALLSSSDTAKRKFAVVILNQDALPIATELLRSTECDDRTLGLLILKDMDLIVSKANLDELADRLLCKAGQFDINAITAARVSSVP